MVQKWLLEFQCEVGEEVSAADVGAANINNGPALTLYASGLYQ